MKTFIVVVGMGMGIASHAMAQDFGAWSVAMGQTMAMNSAICHQSGACGKLTAAQKAQRKAISDEAFNCILTARKRGVDASRKERAVTECKAQRDRQYKALFGAAGASHPVAATAHPTPAKSNGPGADFAVANYHVSTAVTKQVRAGLHEGLAKLADTSAQQQLLAKIDFEAVFESAMQKHGLARGNMIDAMTGYWLTMWSIVHRAPFPDQEAVIGTRAQMALTAAQSGIAEVSSDAKQRESQKLIWQMVLAISAQRQRGDDAKRLAAEMNQVAIGQGLDLSRVTVTHAGFVSR
jgi:hypothetical protein